MKKYLKTIEEVLALKDTDTKIYTEDITRWYCQFIGGVLCRIFTDKTIIFNAPINIDQTKHYIVIEEEANENDIGKLCWFWDDEDDDDKIMDILKDTSIDPCRFEGETAGWYDNCRRLTPEEVAEITGYKVEE